MDTAFAVYTRLPIINSAQGDVDGTQCALRVIEWDWNGIQFFIPR